MDILYIRVIFNKVLILLGIYLAAVLIFIYLLLNITIFIIKRASFKR